jgi:hypothetical protein
MPMSKVMTLSRSQPSAGFRPARAAPPRPPADDDEGLDALAHGPLGAIGLLTTLVAVCALAAWTEATTRRH